MQLSLYNKTRGNVDGLEGIAYPPKDNRRLQQLLEIMRPQPGTPISRIKPRPKTLITTDDFTGTLAHLNADERLDVLDFACDEAEFGPGQRPMSFLSL